MQSAERSSIRCPSCGQTVWLDEGHVHQLAQPLLDAREAEIRRLADIEALASYEAALNDERTRRGELEQRLSERDRQVRELNEQEVNLRRGQRELKDAMEAHERNTARMRDEIRAQERADADARAKQRAEDEQLRTDSERKEQLRRVTEEYEIKLRQKDAQLQRVNDQVKVLERKADSGDRQQEGIARQDLYAAELRRCFPDDVITVTRPGKKGWDITEVVRRGNLNCGTLPHECKRTVTWNPEWVRTHAARVRNDPDAMVGVIVSEALPQGTEGSSKIDGVWVTDFGHAIGLVAVLRDAIIMVRRFVAANAARDDIAGKIFDYFTTGGFEARYKAGEQIIDRLRADNGKFGRAAQEYVADVNCRIDEIWDQCLHGMLLDLIGLGGEVPPGVRAELGEGDAPELSA